MRKLFVLGIALVSLSTYGQEAEENRVLSINSSIIIDQVSNFSGGIETGYGALGLFDFGIQYTPFDNGLLEKTSFHIHLLKTGGKGPTENYIGDAQVVSNIEGKASRFIYEFFFTQQLGDFTVSFGLHDLNTEFMMSEYAGDFINSSFGIFPAVSMNVPVSIFPVTSLGGIVLYGNKTFDLVGGLYNLNNDYIEEEEFTLHNHIFKKGCMGVAELRYRLIRNNHLLGEYKVGGYYKDCAPSDGLSESEEFKVRENHGYYFIADQTLLSMGSGFNLGMFTQVGITPKKTNYVPDYYGAGISIRTQDKKYAPDFIGLAIGRVGLNEYDTELGYHNPQYENAIELSMKKSVFNRITLQPDIQYIINPSGIYKNALVGMLRLQVELNN